MIEDDRDGMFIVYARTEICGTASEGVCLRLELRIAQRDRVVTRW